MGTTTREAVLSGLPTAAVRDRLEWAKSQLGRTHLAAVAQLLIDAGWPVEDARETAMYGLAASYLVAAETEEEGV